MPTQAYVRATQLNYDKTAYYKGIKKDIIPEMYNTHMFPEEKDICVKT
jgi:hypothetical protein